jgi:hypothetical protein
MTKDTNIAIKPLKAKIATFNIEGTAPYVQHKFSGKAKAMMREKMLAGSQAKKSKNREARDFDADFEGATHFAPEGWAGIPAPAFRAAMISACRLVGFKMTLAKLSVFAEADGFDADDGSPLIKIEGKREPLEMHVRNQTGVCDLRVRPMWRQWTATVRIRFDEDQFSLTDVTNLMVRVGAQVGIGEGRPDSRESAGLGWGLFRVV